MDNKEKAKILIVEDEVLIADSIQKFLITKHLAVVGTAVSYEEAVGLYNNKRPDLVLIDIRLNGEKNGIDLARYIQNSEDPVPYIYLTSQTDANHIDMARETFPDGYLTKPIQRESLYTSIEMVLYRKRMKDKKKVYLKLFDGIELRKIEVDKIRFIKSEHVYVHIFTGEEKPVVYRSSLKEILEKVPADTFVQTHRSYAVNRKWASKLDNGHIVVDQQRVPISRTRRKNVIRLLFD